jgi:predicted translin family RNA/ssDNA-binding protein
MTMTAEEALAEVGKVTEQIRELEQKLRQATSGTASEAIPQLQQEIAEATARKEWLLDQIQRMRKAGSRF